MFVRKASLSDQCRTYASRALKCQHKTFQYVWHVAQAGALKCQHKTCQYVGHVGQLGGARALTGTPHGAGSCLWCPTPLHLTVLLQHPMLASWTLHLVVAIYHINYPISHICVTIYHMIFTLFFIPLFCLLCFVRYLAVGESIFLI